MKKVTLVVGCDNAAVDLKREILAFLSEEGYTFEDIGVNAAEDATIYPLVAEKVARAIIESGYEKQGILICGTGIGMAITSNKFPGIYAAVCHDSYSAERAKLSNNANVICMGARIIGPELAKKVLKEWLSLEFTGGRSLDKVAKIKELEGSTFNDNVK
ncbi:MAG TPA: ribose 5-phosphate isomerase B [Bacillota bacterium]|nr:ribose 5-phosphate isomerase B [Bacillota bacterium]